MIKQVTHKTAIVFMVLFQAILVVFFALFVSYDDTASPRKYNGTDLVSDAQYPLFQDVHVMVFVGFGFLMTFLKKYAFSALGFTFFTSSLVMQWGILCQGFIKLGGENDSIRLNMSSLINGDVIAATVMVSLGAVLGKISPVQLLFMAVLETALFALNEYINADLLEAVDAGGSMYVHAFGAYFGLAVAYVLRRGVSPESENNELEASTYQSDINSMIGTLFLWMFWPSFNGGLLYGDERQRAIINTYLALTASCLVTFAMSSAFDKNYKFTMAHIQNATLAGGVCIGTCCNMMVQPYGALLVGSFAGILSTSGFRFIQEFLLNKLHIHDTCGVNNLHGMPGVAAGLIGVILAGMANKETYGDKLFSVFPGMQHRSALSQAGYQMAGLTITLTNAIIGGLVIGVVLKKFFPNITPKKCFNDEPWWEVSD